jgi:hypothetical protein
MLDKNEFVKVMTGMCELFNTTPSDFIFDAYYAIFKDYELDQFKSAVNSVMRTHVYNTLPKPAVIIEFLDGTKDDKALGAWLQVKEAVNKGGYYASIEFADPIISHCLNELGGWMWFCSQQITELPFIEKRFMDLYRLFLKRGPQENVRLMGYIETTNRQKGLDNVPEPVRIGFDKRVMIDKDILARVK